MKKTILTVILMLPLIVNAFGFPKIKKPDMGDLAEVKRLQEIFVSPVGYTADDKNEKYLNAYIDGNVKFQAKVLGLNDKKKIDALIRAEKAAFRQLVDATFKDKVEATIKKICKIGVCSYVAVFTAYSVD